MPDAVFRERPAFGGNVANRPISAAAAVGFPRGPRGIPCSVLCPPDPPAPPPPLGIVSIVGSIGTNEVTVTFDRPYGMNAQPNWFLTLTAVGIQTWGLDTPTTAVIAFGDVLQAGDEVETAPDQTNPFARDGGGLLPTGTYPITFV